MKRIRSWLFLINYYAHDFFTGMWCSSFLVIYLLHERYSSGYGGLLEPAVAIVSELKRLFFFIEVCALVLVIITGVIRSMDHSLGYRGIERQKEKRRFLIIKHLIMGCCFLLGTIMGWWWALSPDFQWQP